MSAWMPTGGNLLFLDEVPPVLVPGEDVRTWRRMIGHRRKLVASRIRSKNAARALLRSQGIEAPKALWTLKGMDWLRNVPMSTELDELQRDILCEQIESLTRMIQRAHKQSDGIARRHPGVQLLMTIPGIRVRHQPLGTHHARRTRDRSLSADRSGLAGHAALALGL